MRNSIVIKDGEIVERGRHDTLLAAHGVYHDLYMSQFRREEQAEMVAVA
jgi:ABC-type multidrug transport system fused ATPase/permease subunit